MKRAKQNPSAGNKAGAARHDKRRRDLANQYPPGWNRKSIGELAEHYENQGEDEAAREIEAAFNDPNQALMLVPRELVPKVEQLLATHRARRSRRAS
jgi:hypothetical protein